MAEESKNSGNHCDNNNNNNNDDDDNSSISVPEAYYCPITHDIMFDPCFLLCGHTFEKQAIEKWLQMKRECPNKCILETRRLQPNYALKSAIEDFLTNIRPELNDENKKVKDFQYAVEIYLEQIRENEQNLAEKEQLQLQQENTENTDTVTVDNWLQHLELKDQYLDVFRNEGFDTIESVQLIEEQDFKDMGIKIAHRRKIQNSLRNMNHVNDNLPVVDTDTTRRTTQQQTISSDNQNSSSSVIQPPDPPLSPLVTHPNGTYVYLVNFRKNDSTFRLNNKTAKLVGYDGELDKYKVTLLEGESKDKDQIFFIRPENISYNVVKYLTFPGYPFALRKLIKDRPYFTFLPKSIGQGTIKPRCEKTQTLLFVGPTGSGKSRLINYLLGENFLQSAHSLQSVTRSVHAARLLGGGPGKTATELFLVDSVGLMDTTLSNKEVLKMASDAIKLGFTHLNRFVLVLRNGRVEPAQAAAIQQAINWFGLENDRKRKEHVMVVITHCDSFNIDASEEIIRRYQEHEIIGKLYVETQHFIRENQHSFNLGNFFCVGLPDLNDLDGELRPIFERRLIEQKAAFTNLFFNIHYPEIKPIPGTFEGYDFCNIL